MEDRFDPESIFPNCPWVGAGAEALAAPRDPGFEYPIGFPIQLVGDFDDYQVYERHDIEGWDVAPFFVVDSMGQQCYQAQSFDDAVGYFNRPVAEE